MSGRSPFRSILVISDNEAILREFTRLIGEEKLRDSRTLAFACHYNNAALRGRTINGHRIEPLDVKADPARISRDYDLVISAHCKQLFPAALTKACTCINIHPGLNPHNRGWYPQVFSILNHLPLGATIHEIDEQLDHGRIIDQEEVEVHPSDTSLSAYERVQQAEFRLLKKNLPSILDHTYATTEVKGEGNLNLKRDFEQLREINLDEKVTFGEAIDRLRALTHPPFKNAYFIDPKTQKKIWVQVTLEEE